ncbi:MAG: hypothetical protein ACOZDD_09585 [Bacteroidota bacterium]
MDFNRMLEEHEKFVPFKKIKPFFILMGIVGVIFILATIINSKMPNRDFYKVELSGRVYEIESRPRDTYFLIGSNWYLIKTENIDIISKGDSISKPQESYMLKVFDKESNVKWQGEVKSLIFNQVDRPE